MYEVAVVMTRDDWDLLRHTEPAETAELTDKTGKLSKNVMKFFKLLIKLQEIGYYVLFVLFFYSCVKITGDEEKNGFRLVFSAESLSFYGLCHID